MYLRLLFFSLLGCTSLHCMEPGQEKPGQESFLNILPQDLKNEVARYLSTTKLSDLPQELQEELIQYLFTPAASSLFKSYTVSKLKPIVDQIRPLFLQEFGLQRIFPIMRQAGAHTISDAIRLAALLNVPSVTAWLKEYIAKQGSTGKDYAGEVAFDVVQELGQLRSKSFGQPLSAQEQSIEKFLQTALNTLLSLDINVDFEDIMNHLTPLQAAVAAGDLATVQLLLQHGARADIKNSDGQSALDIVQKRREKTITENKPQQAQVYQQIITLLQNK